MIAIITSAWNWTVDTARFASAVWHDARAMQADGWWWHAPEHTNQSIRRGVLREMLLQRF